MVLGQPEDEVQRLHVHFDPADGVLIQVLTCPKLEIDEAVVIVVELIRW